MFFITLSVIIGICLGLYLKDIALFLSLGLIICIIKFKKKYFYYILICTFMFAVTRYGEYKYNNVFKNIDKCSGICEVISFSEEKENANKYIVKIKKLNLEVLNISDKNRKNQNNIKNKIKDELIKNSKLILYTDKNVSLEYGDIIYFNGNFQNAINQRNTNGFDYQRYLRQNKIYGILKVENMKIIQKDRGIFYYIFKLKDDLKHRLIEIFNEDKSAFLMGLLLGDKSLLNEDIENDFKNSNLSHILAISGMHVTYVLFGIDFCASKIIKNKKFKNIILIFLLIFFSVFTGSSPSCIRAVIMSCLILISNNLYRKNDFFTSLLLSLNILFLMNYYNIESVGMWLSFLGTFGLAYGRELLDGNFETIMNILKKEKNKSDFKNNIINYINNKEVFLDIKNTNDKLKNCLYKISLKLKESFLTNFKSSIAVQIMIFPIMLYSYNTISLTFFISNFFSSFIIGPIIIFGYIILFLGKFSGIIIFLESIMLDILFLVAKSVGNIKLSKIYIVTPNKIFFVLYYLIILICFFRKDEFIKKKTNKIYEFIKLQLKKYWKIIISIIVICCFINAIYNITNKELEVRFLDVGQGDCSLIITENKKTILIDAGNNEGYDYGENVVMPYLLKNGISKLDYMIISHFDSDHCGGMFYILENMKVDNVVIGFQAEAFENYKDFLNIAKEKRVNIVVLEKGDILRVDKKTHIEVLFPDINKIIEENKINNNSLVFKLVYDEFSILFTGDIEEVAEKQILEEYKNTDILKSTILKVAHHGSISSSIEEFLEQVKPRIALIGVGKDNSYGHPDSEVMRRLKKLGVKVYRTDEEGEISIVVN